MFSLHSVSDKPLVPFQLFSIVCKLLAIIGRNFYILGNILYATLRQFGNIIKVAQL